MSGIIGRLLPARTMGQPGVQDVITLEDNEKLYFGDSKDASVYYDGTNDNLVFKTSVDDSSGAQEMVVIDNSTNLTQTTSRIISFRYGGTEKASIRRGGDYYGAQFVGTNAIFSNYFGPSASVFRFQSRATDGAGMQEHIFRTQTSAYTAGNDRYTASYYYDNEVNLSFGIFTDGGLRLTANTTTDSAPNDDTTLKRLTLQKLASPPTNAAYIAFSNNPGTDTFYLVLEEG